MNSGDKLNQGISALADGECNELETERLLSKLRRSPGLRQRWEQVHTVRAVSRGERVDLLAPGFADRIGKSLETEAHLLTPNQVPRSPRPAPGWLKPAAGFAIAASVALVSVLTGRRAHGEVAMTGEISLRGRVLPVGGIKDKLLAAERAGVRKVILPRRNEKDLVEVPDEEFDSMGCNVLALAPGSCLMLEGNPITRKRLEAAGAEVICYQGEEISRKGCGGPTCLTRPLLREL